MPTLLERLRSATQLRGDEFIRVVREIASAAGEVGSSIVCCSGGCGQPATQIGMQECGAPGGWYCPECVEFQREWMTAWSKDAGYRPYCRHCGQDVDRDHIYTVGLFDTNMVSVRL